MSYAVVTYKRQESKLKRYIVSIYKYGKQIHLAPNLASLLQDLQYLKNQGLILTIICEDKRSV